MDGRNGGHIQYFTDEIPRMPIYQILNLALVADSPYDLVAPLKNMLGHFLAEATAHTRDEPCSTIHASFLHSKYLMHAASIQSLS